MQFVIVALIFAVMAFQYLVTRGWVPSQLAYLPELLALAACVAVVLLGVRSRFQYVRPAYWLVFGALALVIACGAVINLLEPGPLFAGIRNYLRALPFFFLPAVLLFTERQVRVQLVCLLALCLIQAPLAWYQRLGPQVNEFVEGDSVIGTVGDSGILSMFLICAACVLTAFYLRRRVSLAVYIILLLLILIPTTLNETKITLVMLPIALLITFYAGSAPGARLKNVLIGTIVLAGFLSIFIPIYDYLIAPRWGYGILDFLTMEGRVERYLSTGTQIGDQGRIAGRMDGVVAAFSELSKDPTTLIFGYGIGNASDSALGAQFVGAHYETFSLFPDTAFSLLLLELGVLGLAFILLLHWLILLDSFALARSDTTSIVGTIAVAWTGVTAVLVMGIPYVALITFPAVSFMYWYFSGLIVAARMRAAATAGARSRSEPRAAAGSLVPNIPPRLGHR